MKYLTRDEVAINIRESLPLNWRRLSPGSFVDWTPGSFGQPQQGWLEQLWRYLHTQFWDLTQFEGLPVVPVSTVGNKTRLGVLSKGSKIVLLRSFNSVPENLKNFLRQSLDVVWLDPVPHFFDHRSLSNYSYEPTCDGILSLLYYNNRAVLVQRLKAASFQVKDDLAHLLSSASVDQLQVRAFVAELPIFRARSRSGGDQVLFSELQILIEPDSLYHDPLPENISYPSPMISQLHQSSISLAKKLGHNPSTLESFLDELTDPGHFRKFSKPERDSLMCWILKRFGINRFSRTFTEKLKTLKFISLNTLVSPDSLYDPSVSKLKQLFEGEDRFPTHPYDEPSVLSVLRSKLGHHCKTD